MWPVNPSQIVVAMILDLVIGDPRRWPHIARYAGALSHAYERWLTHSFRRTVLLGFLFWLLVVGTMLAGYVLIHAVCSLVSPVAGYVFDIIVIYQAIATRDLHEHVKAVLQPLTAGDINAARERLSWIVGRDTETLDQSEISRATIESVAESLVDGIVAPLFWSVIGGAPGALIYRTANTLDSIIGHRTEAYEKFGKTSARIDDFLNWLPARICALVLCLSRFPASWIAVRREAALHASPNAGWPEAAMAYALGVRLGGCNSYDGERVELPVFNASARAAAIADIQTSLTRMWWVVFAAGGFFLLLSFLSVNLHAGTTRKPRTSANAVNESSFFGSGDCPATWLAPSGKKFLRSDERNLTTKRSRHRSVRMATASGVRLAVGTLGESVGNSRPGRKGTVVATEDTQPRTVFAFVAFPMVLSPPIRAGVCFAHYE